MRGYTIEVLTLTKSVSVLDGRIYRLVVHFSLIFGLRVRFFAGIVSLDSSSWSDSFYCAQNIDCRPPSLPFAIFLSFSFWRVNFTQPCRFRAIARRQVGPSLPKCPSIQEPRVNCVYDTAAPLTAPWTAPLTVWLKRLALIEVRTFFVIFFLVCISCSFYLLCILLTHAYHTIHQANTV